MATMSERLVEEIVRGAEELLAAIDKRWEGETRLKRDRAISPRQEEAMESLRSLLSRFRGES